MILILSIIIVLALFYSYVLKPYKYWQIRGVKYDKPTIFFGCMWEFVLQRMSLFIKLDEIYKNAEGERYCGFFQFQKPILLLRDPELIKTVSIKEFDSFANHDVFGDEDTDPFWSKNLFSSTGEQWHSMRTVLSPCFTGSKMKIMFNLMSDCTENVIKHFLEKHDSLVTLEMKDTFTRMSNDIIATCALGVSCNSIKVPDNDIYKYAMKLTDLHGINAIRVFGYTISPQLMKFFGIKIFPTSTTNFFNKLIKDTLNVRAEKNIIRPDMIQLMLKARKSLEQNSLSTDEKFKENKNFQITDEDITAQALIFLLGGLETTSNLLSFLAYELAINKDIQNKLVEEVNSTLKSNDGKLCYEALQGMKYLDMVINEGLRKWPTMPIIGRMCTKSFEIPSNYPKEKSLLIEKGTAIWWPVYSLHMDPKYFSEPERFDPDRFSDENKSNIIPNTYMPFGIGPRNCIGSRFSLLEAKVVLFHMLKSFEIVPVENLTTKAKFSNNDVMMSTGCDIWLGLKKRS